MKEMAIEDILWLEAHGQRLGLLPRLGGGVAAWQKVDGTKSVDLWRPWDGLADDPVTLASFPMAPWANRIGHGGIEHDGRFHAIAPNRHDQRYPIHGDSWLQPWRVSLRSLDGVSAFLMSRGFRGLPYDYDAEQRWQLEPGGLEQTLRVTHRGDGSMPYGLGVHPWLPRAAGTRVQANVRGVWLTTDDLLPTTHASPLPEGWELPAGIPMQAPFIDNEFTGWDGRARVTWPDRGLMLEMRMLPLQTPAGEVAPEYLHLYRPATGDTFCIEPVTQAVDAFHLEGRPGLVTLHAGESMTLRVQWRFEAL
jgi:aldose 1-epimerase